FDVCQETDGMFSYHSVVQSRSDAYAATSARGRWISISVVTSTAMSPTLLRAAFPQVLPLLQGGGPPAQRIRPLSEGSNGVAQGGGRLGPRVDERHEVQELVGPSLRTPRHIEKRAGLGVGVGRSGRTCTDA